MVSRHSRASVSVAFFTHTCTISMYPSCGHLWANEKSVKETCSVVVFRFVSLLPHHNLSLSRTPSHDPPLLSSPSLHSLFTLFNYCSFSERVCGDLVGKENKEAVPAECVLY